MLYLKPAQNKKTGIKFFNEKVKVDTDFPLNGFRYCAALDNSWFYGNVFIDKLNGTVMAKNPIRQTIIDLIDDAAKNITDFIYDRSPEALEIDVKRLACYLAAQGNNKMANLSDSVFLRNVHVDTYFQNKLPARVRNTTRHPRIKKKFKLAYYILVKGKNALKKLEKLLNVVNDGDACILIQVDLRIFNKIEEELSNILKHSRNIIVAKTGYLHILGHSSGLFSLLNGYFELLDAASWDYVINLSLLDWPLMSNNEIYSILQGYGETKSWISLWQDSKWVANRLFRPHISVHSENLYRTYHSEDFGISYWPMTNWRLFRNSPYTMLSRTAVSFLRDSDLSFQYLAFLEHAYEPEELYVATALMNSAQIQNDVNFDNLRYCREIHQLIGFRDRHLFSSDGKDPRYLFMRPFKSDGIGNQEADLILWLEKKNNRLDTCVNQGLMDNDCLKSFLDRISFEGQVLLIPIISQNYRSLAKNLECSLSRLGYTNVILWTLDQTMHDEITNLGLNSLYEPLKVNPGKVDKRADFQRAFSEQKLSIILKLIKNGYEVFYLDPASVVLKDFFQKIGQFAHNPYYADIMLGPNDDALKKTESQTLDKAYLSSDFIFARKTSGAISLLEKIKISMDGKSNSDFEDALNSVIQQGEIIQVTGLGQTPQEPLYPSRNQQIVQQNDRQLGSDLTYLFNLGFSKPEENQIEISRIHVLDQLEFSDSKLFLSKIGSMKKSAMLVHASNEQDAENFFKTQKLWYLDSQETCISN